MQFFDISVFSPLKRIYDNQISVFSRISITHITKNDFFPAFRTVFEVVFTKRNIEKGFWGSGLIPFNSKAIISKLNIKIRIPSFQIISEAFGNLH